MVRRAKICLENLYGHGGLINDSRLEIIDKKQFAVVILNTDNEIFEVYVIYLAKLTIMLIYSWHQAQVALLTSEKTGILIEYSNFSNVFSSDSTLKLPKYTEINDHFIDLLDDEQSSYSPIYSLGPLELKMLKTYIETNLAGGFIRLSKFPTNFLILFIQKKNSSLRLCIDYWRLNNLTNKNYYPLLLIGELLDCLSCIKHFT